MLAFLKDTGGRDYCNWMSAFSPLGILLWHFWFLLLSTCLDSMETTVLSSSLLFTAWPTTSSQQPASCSFYTGPYISSSLFYKDIGYGSLSSKSKQNKEHERTEESSFHLPEIPLFIHSFQQSSMSSSYLKVTAYGTADAKMGKALSLLSRSSQMNKSQQTNQSNTVHNCYNGHKHIPSLAVAGNLF